VGTVAGWSLSPLDWQTTHTKQMSNYPKHTFQKGDQVTLCGYSDRVSYTVIASTRTTLTIQANKRRLLNGLDSNEPDKLTYSPGGFGGHVSGTQRYEVTPDPDGVIVKAYLKRKERKVWTEGAGTDGGYGYTLKPDFCVGSSFIVEGQSDYYDYNF
jgi:hypothetical protein